MDGRNSLELLEVLAGAATIGSVGLLLAFANTWPILAQAAAEGNYEVAEPWITLGIFTVLAVVVSMIAWALIPTGRRA